MIWDEARKWVSDTKRNRCSVARFGSEEAAEAALASLVKCYDCMDCLDCTDCAGCTGCTRCLGCTTKGAPEIPLRVLIGGEATGAIADAFEARGHYVMTSDFRPYVSNAPAI